MSQQGKNTIALNKHFYKDLRKLSTMAKQRDLETANAPLTDKVTEDYHVVMYRDGFPVSHGHMLFVPKYDTPEIIADAFFDAYQYGLNLVKSGEADGFNVGLNYGPAAGQTVMYPHIHLIPRFNDDVEDPVGGVRNVIPGKGNYKKTTRTL
jgi:diadenosine tetraphosphate (Ap4A) HIT family hydrolase